MTSSGHVATLEPPCAPPGPDATTFGRAASPQSPCTFLVADSLVHPLVVWVNTVVSQVLQMWRQQSEKPSSNIACSNQHGKKRSWVGWVVLPHFHFLRLGEEMIGPVSVPRYCAWVRYGLSAFMWPVFVALRSLSAWSCAKASVLRMGQKWFAGVYFGQCFFCVGVGFVRRPHLLDGGVHSVTTYRRGSRRAARTAGD